MTVLVCRHEAGAVWVENAQGDLVAPCFFKTAEETEDELQAMGIPAPHGLSCDADCRRAGDGSPELGEVFLERPLVMRSD